MSRPMIFLGPPGAGKGTQAMRVAKKCGVPHLSTGDMFRDNISRGTELGLKAKPIMDRGELVPDEIVLGMVEQRIALPDCKNGFAFDGFPRTVNQAEQLDHLLDGKKFERPLVLYIAVAPEALMKRLTGRRVCKVGGEIYNVFENPPKVEGRCDKDGGELFQRPDDRPEVIRERIATFDRQTKPLVDYYRRQGTLVEVDGAAGVEGVYQSIIAALPERAKS
ncbi:MAG: adenylate kinase [Candidatus Acidiferrales bacterium]